MIFKYFVESLDSGFRNLVFRLLPVFICLLSCNVSWSATHTVPTDFATIQAALDAADSGDEVVVLPGTYEENLDFSGKDIDLRSAKGAKQTVIKPQKYDDGIEIGPLASVSGFTLIGKATSYISMVRVRGAGTKISRNVFRGGVSGVKGNASSPIIERNIFTAHFCDLQFTSGVVSFVNASSPKIHNNLFHDNNCRAISITLPSGNIPQVINNTLVRNPEGIRIDGRVPIDTHIYRNNILFDNQVGLRVDFSNASNIPVWTNSLVFGNGTDFLGISNQTGSSGNISVDPEFKCAKLNRFGLSANSPAVNTGSSDGAPLRDYTGRIREGTPDIGAYEQSDSEPLTCPPVVESDDFLMDLMPSILASIKKEFPPEWGVFNNVCCSVSSTTYTVTQGLDQRSSTRQSCSSTASFEGFIPSTVGNKSFTSVLRAGRCGDFPINFQYAFEDSFRYVFELDVVDGFLSLRVFINPIEKSKIALNKGSAQKQRLFAKGGAKKAGYKEVKIIRLKELLDGTQLRQIQNRDEE